MTTPATMKKLQDLVGANDMDARELALVLKNWDAVPKLHTNVVNSVKALAKIPASLQLSFIEASEKAVKAIGELLCEEAQDLVAAEFPDDLPQLVAQCLSYRSISELLWKHLAYCARAGTLKPLLVKKLVQKDNCPNSFAKAAGYTPETFAKARVKTVAARPVRATAAAAKPRGRKPVEVAVPPKRGRKPVAVEVPPKRGRKPALVEAKPRGRKPVEKVANTRKPTRNTTHSAAVEKVKPPRAVMAGNKAKTVKTRHAKDEDFADPKGVATHVRNIRRPRG